MAPPERPPKHGPTGKPEDPGAGRPSVERAMALRDVMTHAVEVEKETHKTSGPPSESGAGRVVAFILCVPLLAFTIYAYVARPEFIWGPNPKTMPALRRDANLRFTMYLLARRIESYHATAHVYPEDLSALDGVMPGGITYARVSDDVFELRAMEGSSEVVFRSDEPAQRFLGKTPAVIAGRSR